ncbi:VOC family protein [Pseudonocardia acaciae]|uniref:VOC family protein n=1 Tax=Pseudonocardia acaciae TaxID=551276 RepID=UPI00048A7AED|nr:VOC family protein [Pseudonocardia acaciae]
MTVELNHTLAPAPDKHAAARFLADILGIRTGTPWGPFVPIPLTNGVSLDYVDSTDYRGQHFAFLVDDATFDAILGRIRAAGVPYWADPFHNEPAEINHLFGGRGLYFKDPAGHNMEILTRDAPASLTG